jgi:hypothetical protein
VDHEQTESVFNPRWLADFVLFVAVILLNRTKTLKALGLFLECQPSTVNESGGSRRLVRSTGKNDPFSHDTLPPSRTILPHPHLFPSRISWMAGIS